MGRRKWIGAIAVATTCALVGAAGGIASSSAAGKTTSSTASASSKRGGGGPGGPGGPAGGGFSIHSESVQLNKAGTAFITVTRDQGTVTAISGSDISLQEGTKTVTYKAVTVTVADGATVTRNDETATLSDIKVGDTVSISQSSDGSQVRSYDPTYKPTAPTGGHGGFGGGHGGPPPSSVTG